MNILNKQSLIKTLILSSTLVTFSGLENQAAAELSTNVGMVSQYHFRGIQQTAGASASAGIDYSSGAFSVGSWAADVQDGLEIDVYGSYNISLESGLSFDIGGTTYQYTGDFDSAYNELNLAASYGSFSLGYAIGQWDGVVGNEAATESDYTVLTLGFEHEGFSGTIGIYGDEAEGEYLELGYDTSIGDFDVGVGVVVSGSDLDDDEALFFSLSKTFGL
jgi:uncharacterized protein (TIGR02001 family)